MQVRQLLTWGTEQDMQKGSWHERHSPALGTELKGLAQVAQDPSVLQEAQGASQRTHCP